MGNRLSSRWYLVDSIYLFISSVVLRCVNYRHIPYTLPTLPGRACSAENMKIYLILHRYTLISTVNCTCIHNVYYTYIQL